MNDRNFIYRAGILASLGAILGIGTNLAILGIPSLTDTVVIKVAGAISFAMILVGLLGLRKSDATGEHSLGQVGIGLAILGQTLTIPYELFRPSFLYPGLGIAAGLMIGIGMLLVGIAVLQTNKWQSWRKYTPLIYGLYPLVLVFIYPLLESLPIFANGADQIFTIIALVCWLLLGIALWVEAGRIKVTPALGQS